QVHELGDQLAVLAPGPGVVLDDLQVRLLYAEDAGAREPREGEHGAVAAGVGGEVAVAPALPRKGGGGLFFAGAVEGGDVDGAGLGPALARVRAGELGEVGGAEQPSAAGHWAQRVLGLEERVALAEAVALGSHVGTVGGDRGRAHRPVVGEVA